MQSPKKRLTNKKNRDILPTVFWHRRINLMNCTFVSLNGNNVNDNIIIGKEIISIISSISIAIINVSRKENPGLF